ncbi:MAG TPA: ABC transporter permease [Candidatus Lokiarchaeia archaeon]|nr:ABC transporter permease [Candidatus Lokiarchaeia archaeon]
MYKDPTLQLSRLAHFRVDLLKIGVLCRKNIDLYVKQGPVVIFGILFPFFLMIAWVIGRNLPSIQLFTGVVSMTSFFTATAISPVVLPWETREKTLERQIASSLTLHQILAGIIFASCLYSITISYSICLIFIGFLSLPVSIITLVVMFGVLFIMALLGSILGVLISAPPTDMVSNINMIANLVKFPLLFISGIFIPLSTLSPVGIVLASCSPVTFLVDALGWCVGAQAFYSIGLDFIVMCTWMVGLYIITYLIHEKTMVHRFALGQETRHISIKNK